MIEIAKDRVKRCKTNKAQEKQTQKKIWVTFTYHSPIIRKITNLFKNTEIRIAFKATNIIHQQLADKTQQKSKWNI